MARRGALTLGLFKRARDKGHEQLQGAEFLFGRIVPEEPDRAVRDDLLRARPVKRDEIPGFLFDRVVQLSHLSVPAVRSG